MCACGGRRGSLFCVRAQHEKGIERRILSGRPAIASVHYEFALRMEQFRIQPAGEAAMTIPSLDVSRTGLERALY